jgi:hypothetical protein
MVSKAIAHNFFPCVLGKSILAMPSTSPAWLTLGRALHIKKRNMKTIQTVKDGVIIYDVFDELETLKKKNTELQARLDATARAVEPVLWEILKEIEEE